LVTLASTQVAIAVWGYREATPTAMELQVLSTREAVVQLLAWAELAQSAFLKSSSSSS
jgi:hypothetical protein